MLYGVSIVFLWLPTRVWGGGFRALFLFLRRGFLFCQYIFCVYVRHMFGKVGGWCLMIQ